MTEVKDEIYIRKYPQTRPAEKIRVRPGCFACPALVRLCMGSVYARGHGEWLQVDPTHCVRYFLKQTSPFQGGSIPNYNYGDHVINICNNKYYDVTTGSGPYQSVQEYLIKCITIKAETATIIDNEVHFGSTVIELTAENLSYYIEED